MYCENCVKLSTEEFKIKNLVNVCSSKDRFIVTVEGTGAIEPVEIIKCALQVLEKKLENLFQAINI